MDHLRRRIERLELLHRVGIALSAEKDRDHLVEMILIEARRLCNADGGTLYLRTENDLHFAIIRTKSLGINMGGPSGTKVELPPIPLYDPQTDEPNRSNVVTYACLVKESVNIPDAYHAEGFDFSGTKAFDEHNGYRSQSMLTIPLVNNEDLVIGALQLLNAADADSGKVTPFTAEHQEIVEALASQAAIALDNQILIEGQKELLESFIKLIAAAIDAKSPYTGAHCERVPVLTEMLTRAACDTESGPLSHFTMSDKDWYELRIAAWLHDCGKVTTPVHVMDKSTKLETIFDRMEIVRARFEVLKREAETNYLKAMLAAGEDPGVLRATFEREVESLENDLAFLEKANLGGEFQPQEVRDRIRAIGARPYFSGGVSGTLLTSEECENLCIAKGTLSREERMIINGHMVQTIKMLEALPFPRHLRRVPEYAGGHHEKFDGTGYPKGLYAGDMSIPARIMAIADVFEALTAQDRPYKRGKPLSETMTIMGAMKRNNHLDPDLLDLFISSGVYREYAERFLAPDLIDETDEAALLAIKPKPYPLPPKEERRKRYLDFLPEYREL